jgi:Lon protease-like protein
MPDDDPPATPLTDDQLQAIADLADSPFEAIAKAEAIRALLAEVERLRAENAAALAELRRIEWTPNEWDTLCCVSCNQIQENGHAATCPLAAVLARATP